jgi:2-polyprenyl-6-methoxyphenol hydroxylase-like FAD-dependent oxidoreductase
LLIGADGIYSTIRKSLFGDEATRFAGYFAGAVSRTASALGCPGAKR